MRYVILFTTIAFFLIGDGLYNEGHYLDIFMRWLVSLMRMVGVG